MKVMIPGWKTFVNANALLAALGAVAVDPAAAHAQSDVPLDTGYVIYEKGPISLPLGIGLGIPTYNRVGGLALPWGPDIKFGGERIKLSPRVTYRSHIGDFDPQIAGRIAFGDADELRFTAGRSTFSNDKWIRGDLMNSLAAIGVGTDARNYFRADRAEAEFFHSFVQPVMKITPSIGALHEYAWSTGSAVSHDDGPWSIFGKSDTLKMLRINPAIARGHTTSGLAGVRLDYDDKVTTGRLIARAEHALDTRYAGVTDSEDFTQFTIDARTEFPTFGVQTFAFKGHGVFTSGDAPPQRFAYLGGSSTLSTVDLLAMGGDRLVFVEGEYKYPLNRPVLQFVGAPIISLRYAAGSAGVSELPDFVQNIGIGIGLKVVKVEYTIDPSYKETPFNKKSAFSFSFSLPF